MRIQHNIMALNASNRLKANDSAISKNIAKLSSGYRINSAADDAAGLAVSEKMRSQINGLNQAQDNAQNGISLVQTAEGGLNETSAILQRMNTLAVESANGTYQDGTDRANLQKEIVKLQNEIDTISTSTNFNQINLLDGSLGYAISTGAFTSVSGVVIDGGNLASGTAFTVTIGTNGVLSVSTAAPVTGLSLTAVGVTLANGAGSYTIKATFTPDTTPTTGTSAADIAAYTGLTSISFRTNSDYVLNSTTAQAMTITTSGTNKGLSLQVGSDNKADQRIHLAVSNLSSKGLNVDGVDISTQDKARTAIDTIKAAINAVSGTRADLGAVQNQLEHTNNNLSTMSENLTSAESQIRDVDMSDEYVQYSKNQILSQAATAMLAQANTQPQNVLTLLKG